MFVWKKTLLTVWSSKMTMKSIFLKCLAIFLGRGNVSWNKITVKKNSFFRVQKRHLYFYRVHCKIRKVMEKLAEQAQLCVFILPTANSFARRGDHPSFLTCCLTKAAVKFLMHWRMFSWPAECILRHNKLIHQS